VTLGFRRSIVLLLAALGIGSVFLGCDQVSELEERQRPSVSGLSVTPDSVNVADLPPEQVQDSVVAVGMSISAQAEDPDGAVERVEFTFEPSSNPRGTFRGTLSPVGNGKYEWEDRLGFPIVDEVYTIRLFAVDDDSLASNQAVGRFRVTPGS
jgi:hypothetical protein